MILKTYIHKTGSSSVIQRYIFKDGRSLADDRSMSMMGIEDWGRRFDLQRQNAGKDFGRRAYHFVLSPDPGEKVTLDEMRTVATSWAVENFPTGSWVVGYHQDGESGILHAHVALNAVDLSGLKFQFGYNDWAELANSAHRIARSNEINVVLPDVGRRREERTRRREALTAPEVNLRSRNGWSWKDDIRRNINLCAGRSHSFEEFQGNMAALGYRVVPNKRGGLTFHHPKSRPGSHNYTCKDCKLGEDYSFDRIVGSFAFDAGCALADGDMTELIGVFKRRKADIDNPIRRAAKVSETRPRSYVDILENRRRHWRGNDARELADALLYLRSNGYRSARDIVQRAAALSAQVDRLGSEYADAQAVLRGQGEIAYWLGRFEDAAPVAMEYSSVGRFARKRFEAENSEALEAYSKSKQWLEGHGIGTDAESIELARLRLDRATTKQGALADEAYEKIIRADGEAKELASVIATLRRTLSPGAMTRPQARGWTAKPIELSVREEKGTPMLESSGKRNREGTAALPGFVSRPMRIDGSDPIVAQYEAARMHILAQDERMRRRVREVAEAHCNVNPVPTIVQTADPNGDLQASKRKRN